MRLDRQEEKPQSQSHHLTLVPAFQRGRALGIHPSCSQTLNIPTQAMKKKKNEEKNAPWMKMMGMLLQRIPTVHADQCHERRSWYPTELNLSWSPIALYVPLQSTDACATLKNQTGIGMVMTYHPMPQAQIKQSWFQPQP